MNILLEIIGTQRFENNQDDKTELTTVGTIEEDAEVYTIEYTEVQSPDLPPIKVCVKVSKDEKRVEMTRCGKFDTCLIIEKSKRCLCHYGTEYGDILMGISGHSIEYECCGDSGQFNFSYDIDYNGVLSSQNTVKINFRKNQE